MPTASLASDTLRLGPGVWLRVLNKAIPPIAVMRMTFLCKSRLVRPRRPAIGNRERNLKFMRFGDHARRLEVSLTRAEGEALARAVWPDRLEFDIRCRTRWLLRVIGEIESETRGYPGFEHTQLDTAAVAAGTKWVTLPSTFT